MSEGIELSMAVMSSTAYRRTVRKVRNALPTPKGGLTVDFSELDPNHIGDAQLEQIHSDPSFRPLFEEELKSIISKEILQVAATLGDAITCGVDADGIQCWTSA